MRNIRHIGSCMTLYLNKIFSSVGMVCLCGNIYSGSFTNSLATTDCSFSGSSQELKLSIVMGINSYPTNVLFAVAKPLRGRQLQEFHKLANLKLHMFSWFGLESFSPIMIGGKDGGTIGSEVAFLYKSRQAFSANDAWRPFEAANEIYTRQNSFYDGVMKLLFMEQITAPIPERFDTATIVMEGRRWNPTFETAIDDFNIDKATFDEVFANHVYMRCQCGPFDIEEDTAANIGAHDASGMDARASIGNTKPECRVTLNRREISETVYWLWNRKGKVDEYASFVKSHPELFEPIADVSEFKTELGKRLLGTWK